MTWRALWALMFVAVGGALGCGSGGGAQCEGVADACIHSGQVACEGDTVRVCGENVEGCLVWSDVMTCIEGTTCGQGGCCGNNVLEGTELCDGYELNGATCTSAGYGDGQLACNATCDGYDTSRCDVQAACGNGIIDPGEQCDGANVGVATCTTEGYYTGAIGCTSECRFDLTGCSGRCGDGVINGGEDCDGEALGDETCAGLGYYGGALGCESDCEYDTSGCSGRCGDGVINGSEECDGDDVGEASCTDHGFYGGHMGCTADCRLDPSTCGGSCGDGRRNGFEECDGSDFATASCVGLGFAAGSLTCTDDCELDTSSCLVCLEGQFHCYGNQVQRCDPGPPASWTTIETCDATEGQRCNALTGTCVTPGVTGGTTPTGTYYQYAMFTTATSEFLGGCDVGSSGDYLYVNRGSWYQDGSLLDVYLITLLDSDGDGVLEPNQHPDNPLAPGPMEERVLTYVTTYSIPELGMVHRSENEPLLDRAYFVSGNFNPGVIFEYDFATGETTVAADPLNPIDFGFMGRGGTDGTFYAAHEWSRSVWSFHQPTREWVLEFRYPNLSGDHMDGMEVVTSPTTGVEYVYVSDMTSDYLGQYRRNPTTGEWVQENVFEYAGTGNFVEGMGFGALNHFWITGNGSDLYEIGGGDLSTYIDP